MPSDSILAINGGSSSIKLAVYQIGVPLRRVLSGNLDRIGQPGATLSWETIGAADRGRVDVPERESGVRPLIDWLATRPELAALRGVGHRIVHGAAHTDPIEVTPDLVADLRRATPYAPEHMPREIELIEAAGDRYPDLPQVACFDTGFHQNMPAVARLLPLPRRYQ